MVLNYEHRMRRPACGNGFEKAANEDNQVIVCDVYGTLLLVGRHGYNLHLMEFLLDARESGFDILIATEGASIPAAREAFKRLVTDNSVNQTIQEFCQHLKMCAKEDMPIDYASMVIDNGDMHYLKSFSQPVRINRHGKEEPSLSVLRVKYGISRKKGTPFSSDIPEP